MQHPVTNGICDYIAGQQGRRRLKVRNNVDEQAKQQHIHVPVVYNTAHTICIMELTRLGYAALESQWHT